MHIPVDSWPVEHVSAAYISNGDVVGTYGELQRRFELTSVTKLLSAYTFLIAIENGVFDYETEIANGATVRQLMSHAGGVGFSEFDRVRPPLTRRVYSSYGFELIARRLETEVRMSMSQYFDAELVRPLGLEDTVLYGSAGHGAWSTVADLQKFAAEVLSPMLLSEETVAGACVEQFEGLRGVVPGYGMHNPCPWGLGFEIHGQKSPHWLAESMPPDVVGHFGQAGTFLWLHRPSRRAMIVLTDRAFGDWAKPLWTDFNAEIWNSQPQL